MVELRAIPGGKNEQEFPDVTIREVAEARIDAEKIFSREEVVAVMTFIAEQEGVEPKSLDVVEEAYTTDGTLVSLAAEVAPSRAKAQGWKSILYVYMLEGAFKTVGASNSTHIARVYNDIDPKSTIGGIVAEYFEGEWEFSPDAIANSADDVVVSNEDGDDDSSA